jgi:hypothetical protein
MMEQSDVEQAGVGEAVYSPCPKCQTASYEYEWHGVWLGYCDKCEKDWNLETKEFLPDQDQIKHQVYIDEYEIWHCTGCKFETWYMQEATNHERDNSMIQTEKKDEQKEELHYCKWVKEECSQQCIYCKQKFDTWALAEKHETPAGRKANGFASYTSNVKHCSHPPKQMIDGKTWGVWVGRRYDCETRLNEFDIVLNLTGNEIGKKHKLPVPELAKWESGGQTYREFVLDWPDRGVVNLPGEFWRDLVNYLKTNKYKMLMFCVGGHGRTGTALASLFVVACGMEPRAAIDLVHSMHCPEAIEALIQEKAVWSVAGKLDKFEAKFKYETTASTYQNNSQTQLLGGF